MIAVGLDGHEVRMPPKRRVLISGAQIDAADMVIFDRLPRPVRDALNTTIRKWTAQAARDALNQGMFAPDLARYIMRMDADTAAQENPYDFGPKNR